MNTIIVAPCLETEITGIAAIQISARKIKLQDAALNTLIECRRKSTDDVNAPFYTLIELVRSRQPR